MNKYAAVPKFLNRFANVPVNPAKSMAAKLTRQVQPKAYGKLIEKKRLPGSVAPPTWKTRSIT